MTLWFASIRITYTCVLLVITGGATRPPGNRNISIVSANLIQDLNRWIDRQMWHSRLPLQDNLHLIPNLVKKLSTRFMGEFPRFPGLFTHYGYISARATRSIAWLLLSQCGWMSVTRWYCIETDKDVIKMFSQPRSPTTTVFVIPHMVAKF